MPAPTEARIRRDVAFSPDEVALAAASDPVRDAQRSQENIVELRKELARTKDPEVRKILMEEYNRQQGPTADSADNPGALEPAILGKQSGPTPELDSPGALKPAVLGNSPIPDVTASPAQAAPGAPQFVGTNAGAVTGIERPRKAGPEPATPEVGPAEKRTALEAGGMMLGATAGSILGGVGEPLGAGVGATAGSLFAEAVDPTTHPIKEALTTGALATGTAGLSALGLGGLRAMIGKPTERGQALLDIMEAAGKVPPAGAVLSGTLVKNMEAIGSADAFFGQKVKDMIRDTGGVVTDDLRNFISGYQRFYGSAREGFKVFDAAAKEAGTIMSIDTSILDKVKAAEKVWTNAGAQVDFPLRELMNKIAAQESATGQAVTHIGVNFEQAEAIRQLLHEQANVMAGTSRVASSAAVGKDLVQAIRKSAYQMGDDIDAAIENAARDGRIPIQSRQILLASRDMWRQWKVGETIQDALGAQLKTAERAGEPITSDAIRGALTSIEEQSAKLKKPLISGVETARLEAIANALQANETAGRASQFTMAVRSGQLFSLSGAGAAAAEGHHGLASMAASVTLIPAAMGFIVRNPTASALLIRGLRLPAGSAAALRASRDLTTMLTKEGFIAPVERTSESTD